METKTTPSSPIFYLLVVNSSRELDHFVSFLFQSLHLVISNLSHLSGSDVTPTCYNGHYCDISSLYEQFMLFSSHKCRIKTLFKLKK